jgi:hypothetical protein
MTNDEYQLLDTIESEFMKKFSIDLGVRDIIRSMLERVVFERPFYKILLGRIKPKVIVITTSYSHIILNRVAQEMGIPVIELQHGMIGPYHVGYSYPEAVHNKVTFPDYLFTFGEFWSKSSSYPIDKEKIVPVGFPYLEEQLKSYKDVKKKSQIVFISQADVGHTVADFAVELAKTPNLNAEIVFKLHPRDYMGWHERYPGLMRSNITVIDKPKPTLNRLFAESTIAVGVFSTGILEAMMFGLDTYVIDAFGVENFIHFIEAGIVKLVRDVPDFVRMYKDSELQSTISTETYFKPNAAQRMARYITRIAQRKKQ